MARYFPAFFDTADKKIIADLIRKKTLLCCKQLQGEEVGKELLEIEKKILTFSAPESFTGNDNAEIRFEKDFEKLCVYLSQELNSDVSHKTVFEFFAAYEFVKKQKDTEKKQLQKWK